MASRQPTPVPLDAENPVRRNRDPLAPEMAYVREEMALNDVLLDIMRQQLALRTARLEEARRNTESKRTQRAQARLRLDTAEAFLAVLSRAEREITSSATRIRTTHQGRLESTVASASAHGQGVAETLDMWRDYERDTERRIEEATVAVGFARAAVAESVEEEADALAREEQCLATVEGMGRWIAELNTINGMRRSRAIWRVPDEVWRHIFLEVVNASEGSSHPSPTMNISRVSRAWNALAEGYNSLWRIIDIDVHTFSPSDAARVQRYLTLRGNLPLTLRLSVLESDAQAPLVTDVLSGVGPVELLSVKGVARRGADRSGGSSIGIAQRVLTAITPPTGLILDFPAPQSHRKLDMVPAAATANLKSLRLNNCCLDYPFVTAPVFPLTTLSFEVPTGTKHTWGEFYEMFSASLSTVEDLNVVADFLEHLRPPTVTQSRTLAHLISVRTDLKVLFLLYRSRIFTPALGFLEIAQSTAPPATIEAWNQYAGDMQGGGSVHTITVRTGQRGDFWHGEYLAAFKGIRELRLHGMGANSLVSCTSDNGGARPFPALERLQIYDYRQNGEMILRFARLYHEPLAANPFNHVTEDERRNMLVVGLWDCVFILPTVSQTLRELGAFTRGGGIFQVTNVV